MTRHIGDEDTPERRARVESHAARVAREMPRAMKEEREPQHLPAAPSWAGCGTSKGGGPRKRKKDRSHGKPGRSHARKPEADQFPHCRRDDCCNPVGPWRWVGLAPKPRFCSDECRHIARARKAEKRAKREAS